MKVFRVSGSAEGLALALDRIHVHCEVLGVVEGALAFEVAIADSGLPDLRDVTVTELAGAGVVTTGLENDRVVLLAGDLLVRPPWVCAPSLFRGIELVVPRAMAFGSGEHASTQSTLLAMHETWQPTTRSCCDVGTGSGVLLAYAAARGCGELAGCDVESEAIAAARELVPTATLVLGGPEAVPRARDGYDTVLANLAFHEVQPALPAVLALWNRRGLLVLGGTRGHEEAARVAARVPGRILATVVREDFVAQVFVS